MISVRDMLGLYSYVYITMFDLKDFKKHSSKLSKFVTFMSNMSDIASAPVFVISVITMKA